MKSVRFLNKEDEKFLGKVYSFDFIEETIELLNLVSKKYGVSRPIISNINYSYDYDKISFLIKSESQFKVIEVDYNIPNNRLRVLKNKTYYDCYDVVEGKLNKTCTGEKGFDKTVSFEKVYTKDHKEYAIIETEKDRYHKYMYNYIKKDLFLNISLLIKENAFFQESMLFEDVLHASSVSEINNMEDLYKVISKALKSKNLTIDIKNIDTDEELKVINGELKTYIKEKKEDDLTYTLYYENGELFVSQRIINPEENKDIKYIKKEIIR